MKDHATRLAHLRHRQRGLRAELMQTRLELARAQVNLDNMRHERDLARQENLRLASELAGFQNSRVIRLRDFLRRGLGWLPLARRLFRPGPDQLHAPEASRTPNPDRLMDHKRAATELARVALQGFLSTEGRLTFPSSSQPRVSIVLVLYNRAELTFGCLQSILATTTTPFELILVDNASADETGALLERLDGVRIIRNTANQGFPAAVNQGARLARGEHLLLLNNDTQLLGPGIDTGVNFLDEREDVGAVGGKILLLDGALQEAGGILWQEAYTTFHGRGQDPSAAAFQVQRDVDYCSGAFLLVRRALFHQVGMLDEAYSPGYYEDVQLCVRLWQAGARVVYHPHIAVLHYENASSGQTGPHALVERNQQIFLDKNRRWLRHQPSIRRVAPHFASFAQDARRRVLVVVGGHSGSVAPLVDALLDLKCYVTVLVVAGQEIRALPDIEWVRPANVQELAAWLEQRAGFYRLAVTVGAVKDLLDSIWREVTPCLAMESAAGSLTDWLRTRLARRAETIGSLQ